MFNALKYTKNLEENGFEREQAETLVGMFMQMIEFNMISKSNFEKFELELKGRFERVDQEFENVRAEMKNGFEKVDQEFVDVRAEMKNGFEKVDQEFVDVRAEMKSGFEKVDQRFEKVDQRFNQVDQRFNQILEEINQKMDKFALQLTVKLGVFLSIGIGLLSTLITLKS